MIFISFIWNNDSVFYLRGVLFARRFICAYIRNMVNYNSIYRKRRKWKKQIRS